MKRNNTRIHRDTDVIVDSILESIRPLIADALNEGCDVRLDQQSVDMIVLVAGISEDRVRKMLGRLPSSSRSNLCDFYDVETFDELVEEVSDRPWMMQICLLKDLGYNVNHGIVKGF